MGMGKMAMSDALRLSDLKACKPQRTINPVGRIRPQAASDRKAQDYFTPWAWARWQCRMRCAYPTYKACKPQRTIKPVGRIRPQAASDRKVTRDTY